MDPQRVLDNGLTRQSVWNRRVSSATSFIALSLLVVPCTAGDLTGNWLIAAPNGDGTMRRTYFHLKQQDGRITGTIRATLHLYSIDKSTGGPQNFTITAAMPLFGSERRVAYRGKLTGDKLHLVKVDAKGAGSEMIAHLGAGWRGRPSRTYRASDFASGSR